MRAAVRRGAFVQVFHTTVTAVGCGGMLCVYPKGSGTQQFRRTLKFAADLRSTFELFTQPMLSMKVRWCAQCGCGIHSRGFYVTRSDTKQALCLICRDKHFARRGSRKAGAGWPEGTITVPDTPEMRRTVEELARRHMYCAVQWVEEAEALALAVA